MRPFAVVLIAVIVSASGFGQGDRPTWTVEHRRMLGTALPASV